MRFTFIFFLTATATVNAGLIDVADAFPQSVEEALAMSEQSMPNLVARKDWLCDPALQSCGTGDPSNAHYCSPNKCTKWGGCIPYRTSTGQRLAYCS